VDPIERTTANLAAYERRARRCFAATEASSDSPWTPSVQISSDSLHLVLWLEDEQVLPPEEEIRKMMRNQGLWRDATRIFAGQQKAGNLRSFSERRHLVRITSRIRQSRKKDDLWIHCFSCYQCLCNGRLSPSESSYSGFFLLIPGTA